jgi:hypothetical protein
MNIMAVSLAKSMRMGYENDGCYIIKWFKLDDVNDAVMGANLDTLI